MKMAILLTFEKAAAAWGWLLIIGYDNLLIEIKVVAE
jgi:hypothetical protein